MYQVKLNSFPNNEVRVTFSRIPGLTRKQKELASCPCQCPVNAECCTCNQNVLVNAPPLTLGPNSRPVENSSITKGKVGWGELPKPTKFGLHARRTILRCGGVLDKIASHPSEVVFLTGTVPNGKEDGRITTSAYSAYIVHALKSWVNKHVPGKKDFYVWEYQKRGALHLHYAAWVHSADKRTFLLQHFHSMWVRILLRITQETGVDLCYSDNGVTSRHSTEKIQAYAQEVHSSATAYLAKYFDKESSKCRSDESVVLYPPSRWWGCSRPLIKLLREMTQEEVAIHISKREALTKYHDVATMLASTSDVAHEYKSKYTDGLTTVCYQTSFTGLQQCQILMQSQNLLTMQNNNAKLSARIITRLSFRVRQWQFTPSIFSSQYTASAALALERLLHGTPLNIIEAMEIASAIQSILSYRYLYRKSKPESAEKTEQEMARLYEVIKCKYQERGLKLVQEITELD